MSQLTGLMGRILALAAAAGASGSVFVESDGGNSTTILQGGPFGSAKVEVSRGDGFVVIERRDDQGNSVTVIQGARRGEMKD
ncbi:MAG: hypothetical protein ACLQL2_09075 [Methylovirgula sp.]